MTEKKLNPLIPKWYPEEIELLKKCFNENKNVKIITAELNHLRGSYSKDIFLSRGGGAVMYRLKALGLISEEEHNKSYLKWKREKNRDRARGLRKIRKFILERDNNQCCVCNREVELHLSHIIPFTESRNHVTKELLILCKEHHNLFDRGDSVAVKDVFNYMCSKYDDYSEEYKFLEKLYSYKGKNYSKIISKESSP